MDIMSFAVCSHFWQIELPPLIVLSQLSLLPDHIYMYIHVIWSFLLFFEFLKGFTFCKLLDLSIVLSFLCSDSNAIGQHFKIHLRLTG